MRVDRKNRKLTMIVFLLLPAFVLPQRPPAPGKLLVTSDPAGANVNIDGNSIGSTPLTLVASPGDHNVALEGANVPKPCTSPTKVTVRPALTASIGCTATGWGQTTYQ